MERDVTYNQQIKHVSIEVRSAVAISASASQRKCDAGVINRALIGQWTIIRSQRCYRRVQEPSSFGSERSYKEAIVRCSQKNHPTINFNTS